MPAGRPRTGHTPKTGYRLPERVLAMIDEGAEIRDQTKTRFVIRAIEAAWRTAVGRHGADREPVRIRDRAPKPTRPEPTT